VYNLRGNARTQGEQRQKEKGNVFGSGTKTPVAITILVKNKAKPSAGRIFYHDIGDYLSEVEKLYILREKGSVSELPWRLITPNDHGNWINVCVPVFRVFIQMGDKGNPSPLRVFQSHSQGVQPARDYWVYNSSDKKLAENIT